VGLDSNETLAPASEEIDRVNGRIALNDDGFVRGAWASGWAADGGVAMKTFSID